MKIVPLTLTVCVIALSGCSHLSSKTQADFKLDDPPVRPAAKTSDERPSPSPKTVVVERFTPVPLPGQLKPVERAVSQPSKPLAQPHEVIDAAHAGAKVGPKAGGYVNAIQIYPFARGALYQIYTAPEQVTDIALQPGERLISVSSGDTQRWILGDTLSGSGATEQVHILVKPVESGLTTNLVITTSVRAYHVELTSFRETYMAAVSWHYPQDELIRLSQSRTTKAAAAPVVAAPTMPPSGLTIDRLNFRYSVDGDEPHWRPLRAFDDGQKVYIQFPARLDQGEAPPLFVVGADGDSQLVNYRVKGRYYIVDRLFARAELRLGEKDQQVVRIDRVVS